MLRVSLESRRNTIPLQLSIIICSYFLIKKRRYVFFLHARSLGNFQSCDKRRCNGLHAYSVGLLFPHLSQKVFLGPEHQDVDYTVPRFCMNTLIPNRNCKGITVAPDTNQGKYYDR